MNKVLSMLIWSIVTVYVIGAIFILCEIHNGEIFIFLILVVIFNFISYATVYWRISSRTKETDELREILKENTEQLPIEEFLEQYTKNNLNEYIELLEKLEERNKIYCENLIKLKNRLEG